MEALYYARRHAEYIRVFTNLIIAVFDYDFISSAVNTVLKLIVESFTLIFAVFMWHF
jgi:hypothetical protein